MSSMAATKTTGTLSDSQKAALISLLSDESPVVKTAASGGRSFQLCPVVIRSQLLRVPFVPFTAGAILDPVGALDRESRI